jgi:type II secretion system protein J
MKRPFRPGRLGFGAPARGAALGWYEPGLRPESASEKRPPAAFTLIEVLLALAICAIVLVAINAVYATAVRLRDRTSSAVAAALPTERAFTVLRRDLEGAVGPWGHLAGDFKCDVQTMGVNLGISGATAGGSGLDFFTTTGTIGDDTPYADVQEVFYELQAPTGSDQQGLDLVRYVNRNLLATTLVTPAAQTLLHDVATLQFDCYDGLQWRSFWDTSAGDTNLPVAVRVRVQLAGSDQGAAGQEPLELTVPLVTVTRTNFTAVQ